MDSVIIDSNQLSIQSPIGLNMRRSSFLNSLISPSRRTLLGRPSSSWISSLRFENRNLSSSSLLSSTSPLYLVRENCLFHPGTIWNPITYSNHGNSRCARRYATANAFNMSNSQEFPSLLIRRDGVDALGGSFAETTAMYLDPDPSCVQDLRTMLEKTKTGIVAHYYMDVELQGVLTSVGNNSNGDLCIGIADSLKMGDMAVEMAQKGNVKQVICLGVDFMAESVQAILNKNGFAHIPVYRADPRKIGCSLAESAETDVYRAWIQKEGLGHPALHVIYINTSLETKAICSSLVPTITCTSSNVLQTILQASAQMGPELKILYGPDTYMGENLVRLLEVIYQSWDDEKIAKRLHPQHTRATIQQLKQNLSVFPSGNCVVHHMFGAAVVDIVQRHYSDCFVTAHLEVPGEMFEVAMIKSLTDDGVVGSTSNILHFIQRKVEEQAKSMLISRTNNNNNNNRLRFILGTEAGMVTSIVKSVQKILLSLDTKDASLEVEIIFPVASEAVSATGDDSLQLVPGVPGGEGCSTAGGCATCPYMKINNLDAVMDLLAMIDNGNHEKLRKHLPPDRLSGRKINGRDATDLGSESILFMRSFMKDKEIPGALCEKTMSGLQTRELLSRS